uniref:RAWUL domain-containing protein n=1 Tax=Mus spicilegus TaxID=10103 RepID=A0A8C6HKZ0_MUSSI
MCNIKIHETQPLLNLKLDRVMQDIVYKLVPVLAKTRIKTAEARHLRRVLCHRPMLNPKHVQLLFDNEVLPDHMTMKQLWLSRWFSKPSPLLLQYSVKEKRR